ncbi:MAG: hypothetical protein ACRCYU_07725 [Nocardioides sp.]
MRSVIVAALIGAVAGAGSARGLGIDRTESLIVLLGAIYVIERLLTEFWKLFVRRHQADAFTIPMRFGVFGRPVDDPAIRYGLGAGLSVLIVATCFAGHWVQSSVPAQPQGFLIVLAGTSGWLTAVGGAWKDAPIEGFSGWKFLRSPAVATGWAVPLSFLTADWVLLSLSAGGFAVASIETYKAFLVRNRPPGKFDGKPVRFRFTYRRDVLAGVHACLWGGLAIALCYGLVGPTAPPTLNAEGMAQAAVAIGAAACSGLVIGRALLLRPLAVAT